MNDPVTQIQEKLQDPNAIRAMILRGTIKLPCDYGYTADLKAQVEELTDKYVSEAQDLVNEQLANDKLHDEIADLKAQVERLKDELDRLKSLCDVCGITYDPPIPSGYAATLAEMYHDMRIAFHKAILEPKGIIPADCECNYDPRIMELIKNAKSEKPNNLEADNG